MSTSEPSSPSEHPCQWFYALGIEVEERQCPEVGDVDIKLRTVDFDGDDITDPITIWLCQKHGKRLVLEGAGHPVPPEYFDDPLIQEEPS